MRSIAADFGLSDSWLTSGSLLGVSFLGNVGMACGDRVLIHKLCHSHSHGHSHSRSHSHNHSVTNYNKH